MTELITDQQRQRFTPRSTEVTTHTTLSMYIPRKFIRQTFWVHALSPFWTFGDQSFPSSSNLGYITMYSYGTGQKLPGYLSTFFAPVCTVSGDTMSDLAAWEAGY